MTCSLVNIGTACDNSPTFGERLGIYPHAPIISALSVRQPFASFIRDGSKTIETRSRKTNYRGPLLICASQKVHEGQFLVIHNEICMLPAEEESESAFRIWSEDHVRIQPKEYPLGVVMCVVNLVDCRPMLITDQHAARCAYEPGGGHGCWKIRNLFIPCPSKGNWGFSKSIFQKSDRMIYTDGVHMVADTLEELHDFAQKIGLKRGWFEKARTHPHYDIWSDEIRARAYKHGAVLKRKREILELSKKLLSKPV